MVNGSLANTSNDATHGPPFVSPLSVPSFLFLRAMSRSFLASVVAAKLVSILI